MQKKATHIPASRCRGCYNWEFKLANSLIVVVKKFGRFVALFTTIHELCCAEFAQKALVTIGKPILPHSLHILDTSTLHALAH